MVHQLGGKAASMQERTIMHWITEYVCFYCLWLFIYMLKINNTHTHNRLTAFVRDNTGRPVPEETLTHSGPILSMFFALIVHSELKSVHSGFPVAFIF